MKVTKQETLYHEDYGATLKHKCGKKDSNIVPSLFFSHFLGLLFFMAFLFFFLFGLSFFLFFSGQCSINDVITLLFIYNSILEQSMTLYECLRRCTGICNGPRVTCMKELWMVALPQILCQLHDHAKQYDNDERVMINGTVEVAWKYISEWLWKCHNR